MKPESKKSKKKQLYQQKKRDQYIYARTMGEVSSIEFTIDESTGSVSFGTQMENCYSEVSYKREGKQTDKSINRVYQDTEFLNFDMNHAIFNTSKRVIALDANQKLHNDVWITAVVAIEAVKNKDKANSFGFINMPLLVVIRFDKEKITEKEGWYDLFNALFYYNLLNVEKDTFFIVDSHLSEIASINSRKSPLCNDFFLPKKFELAYASADVGKEFPMNQLISVADSISSQCIDNLAPNMQETIQHVSKFNTIERYVMEFINIHADSSTNFSTHRCTCRFKHS